MLQQIIKRDRSQVPFRKEKIIFAIFKAAGAVGGNDFSLAEKLASQVLALAEIKYPNGVADVEGIQDLVEKVLIEAGHAKTAKAYILYREKRRSARESNALIGATINMFSEYLNDRDWQINENANTQKSINGLNNYVREAFTQNYWLHEIYPDEIRNAHLSGDLHIHDLGFFGPYCAGWDLQQILRNGFAAYQAKWNPSHPNIFAPFWDKLLTPPSPRRAKAPARRPGLLLTPIALRLSVTTTWTTKQSDKRYKNSSSI